MVGAKGRHHPLPIPAAHPPSSTITSHSRIAPLDGNTLRAFAAVFGGTRTQISGPTGPMTIAMAVVISGFMSGVGIIIMLMQLLPFLGLPPVSGGPVGVLRALPDALANMNASAVALGSVALVVAVLWPRRLAKYLPGLLVALLAGTVLSVLWLSDVSVIGAVPSGLPGGQVEWPELGFLLGALKPALILALLGSVDSLLTPLVADSLSGTRHNPDRELVGQGIGNMVAGVFGGLPGAGAITRIHRIRRAHLIVMVLTLGLTVFVDLVTAVAFGLIAAGMVHARQLESLELDSVVSVPILDHVFFAGHPEAQGMDLYSARVGVLRLKGNFTVASSQKLYGVIGEDLKDHEVVIFDFTDAVHIDDSAAMTISRLIITAGKQDTQCIAMGLSGSAARTLGALDTLRDLPGGHVVETMDEAREMALGLLVRSRPSGAGARA